MYMAVKHLHMTFALISIGLFVVRFFWIFMRSSMMNKKWVKIVPHVNDTLLLTSAFVLAFTLYANPFVVGWVVEKLIMVVAYIGLGIYTFRLAKTRVQQGIGFVVALAVLLYILKIAVGKVPFILPVMI